MTDCSPGDVVLTPFPFSDLETTKKRPALVLCRIDPRRLPSLFILAMMTSRVESEKIPGDYLLVDWRTAGLLYPSKVRLAKVVSVEQGVLLKRLGSVDDKDREAIKKELKRLLSCRL